MSAAELAPWRFDWLWGLPLILATVVLHVTGLGLTNAHVVPRLRGWIRRGPSIMGFALIMGAVTLLVTLLHGLEAAIWAVAYWLLGATPTGRDAMLYSLGAVTTYGHAAIYLARDWQLLGTIEALDGLMLFGLTTAFMFAIIELIWPLDRGGHAGRAGHPAAADIEAGGGASHSGRRRVDQGAGVTR